MLFFTKGKFFKSHEPFHGRRTSKNQKKKFNKNKLKSWIRTGDIALHFFVPIDGRESGSAILKLVVFFLIE